MISISDPAIAAIVATGVVIGFLTFFLGARRFPREVPYARFDAMVGRIGDLEIRVGGVEGHLKTVESDGAKTKHDVANIRMTIGALPSVKDVSEVKIEIARLAGKVEGNGTMLTSLSASNDRIEGFLMKATAERIVSGQPLGGGER